MKTSAEKLADLERPVAAEQLITQFAPDAPAVKSGHPWAGWLLVLLFFGGLFAAWRWTPLSEYVTPQAVGGWATRLANDPAGPLLVIAAYTLATLTMFPRPLVTLAAVLAFGPLKGFVFALVGFLAAFGILVVWWWRIPASHQRDWQPEVALLPHATVQGERVTLHNIRLLRYRTETDFERHYYDKTFDVSKLQSVDMVAVYWMGPAIAHTLLSFGFEGGDHLAVSIETRKEKNEAYSTIRGFFKQYELYYVVADERDVIRLRTNYRKDPPEDVYIYRLHAPIENGRKLFLEYMRRVSKLSESPAFYNTLTDNCTTGIWMNTRVNPGHPHLSWKILASGYVPEYLSEAGRLAPGVPFAELQRLGHVNARAQAADQAADFSRRIREGIPGMKPARE